MEEFDQFHPKRLLSSDDKLWRPDRSKSFDDNEESSRPRSRSRQRDRPHDRAEREIETKKGIRAVHKDTTGTAYHEAVPRDSAPPSRGRKHEYNDAVYVNVILGDHLDYSSSKEKPRGRKHEQDDRVDLDKVFDISDESDYPASKEKPRSRRSEHFSSLRERITPTYSDEQEHFSTATTLQESSIEGNNHYQSDLESSRRSTRQSVDQAWVRGHDDIFHSERIYLSFSLSVKKFVSQELNGKPENIWDLVVLSGHEENIWAGSVGEYINARWPQYSTQIKRVLLALAGSRNDLSLEAEEADIRPFRTHFFDDPVHEALPPYGTTRDTKTVGLADMDAWTIKGDSEKDLTVSAMSTVSAQGDVQMSLSMTGASSGQAELIEAVGWLFAVLHGGRAGPFPCMVRPRVRNVTPEKAEIFLQSRTLKPFEESTPGNCWTPLLPGTACASNFAAPTWRPLRLKGIMLSFDLLCQLTGVRYCIQHEGCEVLYGDRAMVYPIFCQANCVQWHFQQCDPGESPHVDIGGARLFGKDLEELQAYPNHFIGLWAEPEITLGTESLEYPKLKYSNAATLPEMRVRDSFTVGGSIALPKIITLTGNVSYKVAKSRVTQFMKGSLPDALHAKINSPVLLYGPSEKRAWLVSYVSVILHLARARALLRAELNYHMPACERRADGGRAAWECIRSCHTDALKHPEENETLTEFEKGYKVADHVQEVIDSVERARRATNLAKGFFRDRIVGYELAAIAKYKDSMDMKRCKLEAFTDGWGPLLQTVELVFFYEGLQDPIVPAPHTTQPSSRCKAEQVCSIPTGFSILTASIPCLVYLAEQQGSRPDGTIRKLTPSHVWHCPSKGGIFGRCDGKVTCSCNWLQELRSSSANHTSPRLKVVDSNTGVVAFKYATSVPEIQSSIRRQRGRSSGNARHHKRSDSGYSSIEAINSDTMGEVESDALASDSDSMDRISTRRDKDADVAADESDQTSVAATPASNTPSIGLTQRLPLRTERRQTRPALDTADEDASQTQRSSNSRRSTGRSRKHKSPAASTLDWFAGRR